MTEKEIYKYLNEVETNFEDVTLSEIELARLTKLAKDQSIPKTKSNIKKILSLAASFIFIIGCIGMTNEKVRAEVVYFVEEFFTDRKVAYNQASDLPEDIQKYSVNLHETVTLQHLSFVVEDVLVDGRIIYLNTIYPEEYSRFNKDYNNLYIANKVIINGEKYSLESYGGSNLKKIGDGLVSETNELRLEEDMPDDQDLNIIVEFENWDDRSDRAAVEANISMAEINENSKIFLKDYEIGNSDVVVKTMKINLLNPRIETIEPPRSEVYVHNKIIGKNKEGKNLVFEKISSHLIGNKKYCEYKFVEKDNEVVQNREIDYKLSDYTIEELNQLDESFEFQLFEKKYEESILGGIKRDASGRPIIEYEKIVGDSFIVNFGNK